MDLRKIRNVPMKGGRKTKEGRQDNKEERMTTFRLEN